MPYGRLARPFRYGATPSTMQCGLEDFLQKNKRGCWGLILTAATATHFSIVMKRSLLASLIFSLFVSVQAGAEDNEADAISSEDQSLVDEASIVAANFLEEIDRGNAERAQRHSYLKDTYSATGRKSGKRPTASRLNLQARINTYKTYGRLISRNLKSAQIVNTLSSMPDSRYVVLKYELEFDKKQKETETVVVKAEGEQRGTVVRYPFAAILAR